MVKNTRQYLRHEAIVGGISNALFNGVVAWLLLRNGPALAWSGAHSFVIDIIATAFILPLIVALIVIPLQRRKRHKGQLQNVHFRPSGTLQAIANKLPNSLVGSALLFGLIGLVIFAPVTVLAFYILQVVEIAPLHYAIFKGVWAGAIAAILVPPMLAYAFRPTGKTAQG